jgi:hypothetical protein
MSIRDQEYGASSDLQQLYPFRMKSRFVEVGPVDADNRADAAKAGATKLGCRMTI